MAAALEIGTSSRLTWLLETALRRVRAVPGGDCLVRAAVVGYHPPTETVWSAAFAGRACPYLDRLDLPLSDLPGLDLGTRSGRYRIIHDIAQVGDSRARHVQALLEAGIRSSLTAAVPGLHEVGGFLFLNAEQPGAFTPDLQAAIRPRLDETLTLVRRELNRPITK
ncbi:putative GAF domain [Magnetospirillum sp. LM-5]|uniref:hypothetical protein n=1 Tax=Magnetospirillum sp. LM-5 TaxID=2681466 RepID=UPI001381C929|nr:hypothetical protein [Magnetospirillum sp. LM-5]CAA7625448.1 putative GAF domain [Magnetospirillum sp. LM-5]